MIRWLAVAFFIQIPIDIAFNMQQRLPHWYYITIQVGQPPCLPATSLACYAQLCCISFAVVLCREWCISMSNLLSLCFCHFCLPLKDSRCAMYPLPAICTVCLTPQFDTQCHQPLQLSTPIWVWQVTDMLAGAGAGLPAGHGHCVAVLQGICQQEEYAGRQSVANQAQLPRYAPRHCCQCCPSAATASSCMGLHDLRSIICSACNSPLVSCTQPASTPWMPCCVCQLTNSSPVSVHSILSEHILTVACPIPAL